MPFGQVQTQTAILIFGSKRKSAHSTALRKRACETAGLMELRHVAQDSRHRLVDGRLLVVQHHFAARDLTNR